jgi:DNA-binding transcriptional ArsR family regulator
MAPSSTIEAIAEPTRRRILDALVEGEQPVQALVERLSMSQPAVSKQLRALRDVGLVDFRPDGQRRIYRVKPEPLLELDVWLEPYRRMWRQSLGRLADQLERNELRP